MYSNAKLQQMTLAETNATFMNKSLAGLFFFADEKSGIWSVLSSIDCLFVEIPIANEVIADASLVVM